MIWLALSIVLSTALFLIFKAFHKLHIHVLPAIVVNYFTCFVTGNLILGESHLFRISTIHESWFFPSLGTGLLFVGAFYLMGTSTRHAGGSATSVASKMSVVIPAGFAIFFYSEKLLILQLTGIILSILSVYLMSPKTKVNATRNHAMIYLIMVFFSSGIVDTGLNVLKHTFGSNTNNYALSTMLFGSAFGMGTIAFFLTKKHHGFGIKEILGGLILGITNFFSLIAMFKAIEIYKTQTAWFFAVNNIGIVALSSVLVVILFKEQLTRKAMIGLGIASLAILLMNYNAFF